MSSQKIPTYRLHKSTGQAVATIVGRDYYLGQHGTPESRECYNRLIAEWLSNQRAALVDAAPDLTITEVLAAYLDHCRDYYGEKTSQFERVKALAVFRRNLYGTAAAKDFGPRGSRRSANR